MLADCLKTQRLVEIKSPNKRERRLIPIIFSPYVGEIEGMFSDYTIRPLLSGHLRDLIKVGRLTEVQYQLDRKGSKHDFMASIYQNAFK